MIGYSKGNQLFQFFKNNEVIEEKSGSCFNSTIRKCKLVIDIYFRKSLCDTRSRYFSCSFSILKFPILVKWEMLICLFFVFIIYL